MQYSFEEIDILEAILEAESDGREFDAGQARWAALRLADRCPEIAASMNRVAARMLAQHGVMGNGTEAEVPADMRRGS